MINTVKSNKGIKMVVPKKNELKPEIDVEDVSPLSELEEAILTLLINKELYGLQIIDGFEKASNGKRHLSIGSLYPTLHRLELKGYVFCKKNLKSSGRKSRRKYFTLSVSGTHKIMQAREFRSQLQIWQPST